MLEENIIILDYKYIYDNSSLITINYQRKNFDTNGQIQIFEQFDNLDNLDNFDDTKVFLTLKSNNLILNSVGKNFTINYCESNEKKHSLFKTFSTNINVEIPLFKNSNIYNMFGYLNLYFNNVTNAIIKNVSREYFKKLDNNIIYCINLKKRTDRWEKIQSYKFDYFEIKKFNGLEPNNSDIDNITYPWEGCAKSHMELVKYAKENKLEYIIVAEDDFINVLHNRLWELRLIGIINWLNLPANKNKWDVFNGFPANACNDFLVNKPINLIDKQLGIIDLTGGFNTHFMIYNSDSYDKILSWFDDLNPNDTTNLDLKKNSPEYNYKLTIDVWLSTNTKMITCYPLLTNSNSDDSDIISNNNLTKKNFQLNKIIIEQKKKKILELIEKYIENDCNDNYFQDMIKENKQLEFIRSNLNLNNYSRGYFKNNSQIISNFIETIKFNDNCEKLFGSNQINVLSDTIVIIFSFNGFSFVSNTIASFIKFNSYEIAEIIIINFKKKFNCNFECNLNLNERIKQLYNYVKIFNYNENTMNEIIELYSNFKYVFILNDNWEFIHSFFIEQSKIIIENNEENYIKISLRDIDDIDGKILSSKIMCDGGIYYWKFKDYEHRPIDKLNCLNYLNFLAGEPNLIKMNTLKFIVSFNEKEYQNENYKYDWAIIPGGYVRYVNLI